MVSDGELTPGSFKLRSQLTWIPYQDYWVLHNFLFFLVTRLILCLQTNRAYSSSLRSRWTCGRCGGFHLLVQRQHRLRRASRSLICSSFNYRPLTHTNKSCLSHTYKFLWLPRKPMFTAADSFISTHPMERIGWKRYSNMNSGWINRCSLTELLMGEDGTIDSIETLRKRFLIY